MPISLAMARTGTPAVPSAAICAPGTDLISSAVGWRARATNRRGAAPGPSGVGRLAADVSPPEGAKAAAAGAAVVYHCAHPPYPRWPEQFPPLTAAVADGAAAAGAK